MSFSLRWVGASEQELDRVAEARMRGYAHAAREIERYKEGVRADPRAAAGDFLLAEQDGVAVGTATALSLSMWMRGARVPCQGVAYVGTIKTHRRSSAAQPAGTGIATRVMHETLRLARERGQVVSALMPFRASFYEHFGYGLVERRCDWTVPLSVLPTGALEGVRFFEPGDLPELRLCRQRMVERGQCDIERSAGVWDTTIRKWDDGFLVVDRPKGNGAVRQAQDAPVHGWAYIRHSAEAGRDLLRVGEIGYDDTPALLRLLHFLASLRDQYGSALLTLPADVQLNRLLRESQLPHRLVNHPTAECRPHTRMQLRILDPKRLIEAMHLPACYNGEASVAVRECDEGESRRQHVSRFRLEITQGRGVVKMGAAGASSSAAFECADTTWAATVSGDLPATSALRLGLANGDASAAALLDAFARGPAPACVEYF